MAVTIPIRLLSRYNLLDVARLVVSPGIVSLSNLPQDAQVLWDAIQPVDSEWLQKNTYADLEIIYGSNLHRWLVSAILTTVNEEHGGFGTYDSSRSKDWVVDMVGLHHTTEPSFHSERAILTPNLSVSGLMAVCNHVTHKRAGIHLLSLTYARILASVADRLPEPVSWVMGKE